MGDVIQLDNKGDVVESKGLLEALEEKRPDLADRVHGLMEINIDLRAYVGYLYATPRTSDLKPGEVRSEDWEKYVQTIAEQPDIEKILGLLLCRFDKKDLTDDKVVVVRSDRPFYDTLFVDEEHRIGTAEGWVGQVESFDITNTKLSNTCSMDGKVYKRFKLKNARPLTVKELKAWASACQLWAVLRNIEAYAALTKKLKESPLGDQEALIYDKISNIDHAVLHHVLKENEIGVADITDQQVHWVDVQQYYGERQIPGSQLRVAPNYLNDPWRYGFVYLAQDPRPVGEIYRSIEGKIMEKFSSLFTDHDDLLNIHVYVGKSIRDFLTPEQKEYAKNSPERTKWVWKYIKEQGLEITDRTVVKILPWTHRKVHEKVREELHAFLDELMPEFGYERAKMELPYGWNPREDPNNILRCETNPCFMWNMENFAGELMIFEPRSFGVERE